MATDKKAVTAYLPKDIEDLLERHCLDNGIVRGKSDEVEPSLGTGIVDILGKFLKGDIEGNVQSDVLERMINDAVEARLGQQSTTTNEGENDDRLKKLNLELRS